MKMCSPFWGNRNTAHQPTTPSFQLKGCRFGGFRALLPERSRCSSGGLQRKRTRPAVGQDPLKFDNDTTNLADLLDSPHVMVMAPENHGTHPFEGPWVLPVFSQVTKSFDHGTQEPLPLFSR